MAQQQKRRSGRLPGRPRLAEKTDSLEVTLPADLKRTLRLIGGGNASAGARTVMEAGLRAMGVAA